MFDYVAIDTETTGLDLFHDCSPFMIGTLNDQEEYRVWEFEVDPFTRKVNASRAKVEDFCQYINRKKAVFHHAKYDIRALSLLGVNLNHGLFNFRHPQTRTPDFRVDCRVEEIHDTQILSHVTNSQGAGGKDDEHGIHGLKALGLYYLDIPESDEKQLKAAVNSARRIGKKLGWRLGKSLKGKPSPGTDYWMPGAVWKCAKEISEKPKTLREEAWAEEIDPDWESICKIYLCGDVLRTLSLFFLLQEIARRDGLLDVYDREMRLMRVVYNMEHEGMYIHRKYLDSELEAFTVKSQEMKGQAEEILCKASGINHVNVNSPLQLAPCLDKCGVKLHRLTEKGQVCTDANALRSAAQWAESTDLKGNARNVSVTEAGKALRLVIGYDPDEGDDVETKIPGYKTYVVGVRYLKGYYQLLDTISKVHSSFNQVGTIWTRFSSSSPNGQNVSKKAVLPLRRVFGPPPGYVWIPVDYEQLELRIFAYASGDKGLIEAFEKGIDFHMATACEMFQCGPKEITSERRRAAKYVNFGIIFGAGPAKVDQQSGQPGTYNLYMAKFPNARNYMARVMADVETYGYVKTLGGYRLYVKPEKPYAGVNGIVQGTAGEIVKNAMVNIHECGLVDWNPPTEELPFGGSSIVCNVHDELVFQMPASYPYRVTGKEIMANMEEAGRKLGVITPVDAKLVTGNWAEGEKF